MDRAVIKAVHRPVVGRRQAVIAFRQREQVGEFLRAFVVNLMVALGGHERMRGQHVVAFQSFQEQAHQAVIGEVLGDVADVQDQITVRQLRLHLAIQLGYQAAAIKDVFVGQGLGIAEQMDAYAVVAVIGGETEGLAHGPVGAHLVLVAGARLQPFQGGPVHAHHAGLAAVEERHHRGLRGHVLAQAVRTETYPRFGHRGVGEPGHVHGGGVVAGGQEDMTRCRVQTLDQGAHVGHQRGALGVVGAEQQ